MKYAKLTMKQPSDSIKIKWVEIIKVLKDDRFPTCIKGKCLMCNADKEDVGRTFYYDKKYWDVITLTKEQVFMEMI